MLVDDLIVPVVVQSDVELYQDKFDDNARCLPIMTGGSVTEWSYQRGPFKKVVLIGSMKDHSVNVFGTHVRKPNDSLLRLLSLDGDAGLVYLREQVETIHRCRASNPFSAKLTPSIVRMITHGHYISTDRNCNPGLSVFCFPPKSCLTAESDYGCAVTAVDAARQIKNFTTVLRLIFGTDSRLAKQWDFFALSFAPLVCPFEITRQIAKNPFYVARALNAADSEMQRFFCRSSQCSITKPEDVKYPRFSLRDVEYDIVYKSSFGRSSVLECIKASVMAQLKRDITIERPAKKSKRETEDCCVNEAKQWSVGDNYDSIFSAARVAANPPPMLSVPQVPPPPFGIGERRVQACCLWHFKGVCRFSDSCKRVDTHCPVHNSDDEQKMAEYFAKMQNLAKSGIVIARK
jgi:hypothetical protein